VLVAVSGYADADHRGLAYAAGYRHFPTKPVSPVELPQVLPPP
jgi:CheY-like chemotaxis protein